MPPGTNLPASHRIRKNEDSPALSFFVIALRATFPLMIRTVE
jgi:hypothetical protein